MDHTLRFELTGSHFHPFIYCYFVGSNQPQQFRFGVLDHLCTRFSGCFAAVHPFACLDDQLLWSNGIINSLWRQRH
jgi:hypothetical protein